MGVSRTMTMEQDFEALDQFPVGMRVLAVDDDQTCLRILQSLLHRCQYHVTTTNQAQTALELLRENKNKFDLVISDVDMPDMDGFKLLELVGLEMELPVIMLSAHSDPEYVMKGVTHGACDYLLKPVRYEELKNIWQHVVRKSKLKKKTKNSSNVESSAGNSDQNGAMKANRKRKDQYEEEEEVEERGNENDDPTAQKKPRVVWTPELHKKFLVAVEHLGVEKAVPKKILDLMNDETLTRENVASHLQKFRLALKKINSENSQQAHMGSHFMQIGGFHHHRPIPGQFHGTMRHYPPNGNLGRLNSAAGMFQQVSSSLPLNHNNERNILHGLPVEELQINNNNKTFPSYTSPHSSLMVAAPNNHLIPPQVQTNKRLEQWPNAVLSNNIQQSHVRSKPDALEWNFFSDLDTNPTAFCGNNTNEFLDPLQQHGNDLGGPVTDAQLLSSNSNNTKEGFHMGQQHKFSDAGSLDDIVNSIITPEHSQADFSGGDLGFGGFSFLRTCI